MDLSGWEESDAHIYGRNMMLCFVASRYLPEGVDGEILLTVQKDEMTLPDRTPEFMRQMGVVLTTLRRASTRVFSPWMAKDKTEMVSWLLEYERPDHGLLHTTSCYQRGGRSLGGYPKRKNTPCGDCSACFRRAVAFGLNGIFESHSVNPMTSKTANEYRKRAQFGEFSDTRKERILQAMDTLEKRYA
jgi:7-cyano-7-deazaguanine synthase in queuosine biosynthesis